MITLIRKKYLPVFSPVLSVLLAGFLCISQFPFMHNLNADFNVWNVKSFIILEGEHNHEPNPQSALIDYHKITIVEVEECLACHLVNSLRFLIINRPVDYYYKIDSPICFLNSSFHNVSQYYNLPPLRAPPIV